MSKEGYRKMSKKGSRKMSKKGSRKMSKKGSRKGSRKSPRVVYRTRVVSKFRQTPCSRLSRPMCQTAMDNSGLRRCRVNVMSGSCETLPIKFRAQATSGIQREQMGPVGKLRMSQLKPFQPQKKVGRLSPDRLQFNPYGQQNM